MRQSVRPVSFLLLIIVLSGCATYRSQYVSFRPPEAYANRQVIDGISIGGEAYADEDEADEAFGFDIRKAGLLPVMLVLNNKSSNTIELVSGQTFLVDEKGGYWTVLPNRVAVERVERFTTGGAIAGGAGRGAFIGGAAGTILGAAIGIVSGSNVGSSMGKGAALGAAGGAVIGGSKEGSSPDGRRQINSDMRTKGLEGKPVPGEYLANGFLFFPGEAQSARELRLQYREKETGRVHNVVLDLTKEGSGKSKR